MSMNSIPKKVDCVIIGTGLTNSILAAACSRIGKSVLHVDKESYYGNEYASFTFQQLIDWIRARDPQDRTLEARIPDELNNKSRMFCIDLCPRLLYSDGSMVNLLVKSNVSRYHEFKNNIRVLSMLEDEIHVMPCRRSDVFTSELLTDLIDKRKLMKFVELCIKYDTDDDECPESMEVSANADKPIGVYLADRGIKESLRHHIIYSIAMVTPDESTKEACKRIKKFMVATERFGRSPFLFPLYGCGEYPQSFCRLSAVYGGTYCLNTDVERVELPIAKDSESSSDTSTEGQLFSVKLSNVEHHVRSDMLIIDHHVASELKLTQVGDSARCDKLARCILITKQSILSNETHLLSFLRIAPGAVNQNTTYLLELNSSISVCPPELNIVYLWCKSSSQDARADLCPIVDKIFGKLADDAIMWRHYYLSDTAAGTACAQSAGGLVVTSPPSGDLDYANEIEEAERIFKQLCPNEEFLPRAPDPDEMMND